MRKDWPVKGHENTETLPSCPVLDSLEFNWQVIRYALIFVSTFFRQRASLMVALEISTQGRPSNHQPGNASVDPTFESAGDVSRLVSIPVVGGLHHRYIRVAA